jgi:ATP-binding cassette, subfamily B, heavy metal transporter
MQFADKFTEALLYICLSIYFCFRPVAWIGAAWGDVSDALTNMEHVIDVVDTIPEVQDLPDAIQIKAHEIVEGTFGELTFENVSFHYRDRSGGDELGTGGIFNVSFRVAAGKTVAICGPTGSGKSTVARLLVRFYDVDDGRILLDDVPISRYTQASLRKCIGIVSQNTELFDDTLRFNISYGRPEATDEEVWAAVQASALTEFVRGLPLGLDTTVGARGVLLSGGQKQRIAQARCICKKPMIVLLDESTSVCNTSVCICTTDLAVLALT